MANINVVGNRCIIDEPLYQWDKNQILKIYGLSLPSIPEIHFANTVMDAAIVRQSTMDSAGVISVQVPNAILQKPYTISVYVCKYDSDTFESLYQIDIPVKARKQPVDYSFIDDGDDIYSYNTLDNRLTNVLAVSLVRYDEVNTKYEQVNAKYNNAVDQVEEAESTLNQAMSTYNSATNTLNQATIAMNTAKNTYDNASGILADCEDATADCRQVIEDAMGGIGGKENKAVYSETTLLAANWNATAKSYSFESTYPAATYDLEMWLNSTATDEQAEAFNGARIESVYGQNVAKARGDVPTVDIPVIIKAVAK